MSESASRMSLASAVKLADKVKLELAPGCQRIEIAGSVRREKESIGDLEVVCIAKPILDLFGEPTGDSHLDFELDRLIIEGRLEAVKGGDRYRQYLLPKSNVKLDLFIATPETWACIFLIRTGSAELAKKIVTQKIHGGFCPQGMKFDGGKLWKDGHAVDVKEEIDVFNALGLAWIDPKDRSW